MKPIRMDFRNEFLNMMSSHEKRAKDENPIVILRHDKSFEFPYKFISNEMISIKNLFVFYLSVWIRK